MYVNTDKSGVVPGAGADKLRIIIDGPDRAEIEDLGARDMARKAAAEAGFGDGGMCDSPVIGPIGPDGNMLEGADAVDPNAVVQGFRAEYLFAHRA